MVPQDIITDDEIISDSYDLKEIDGVVYEADCKKITVGGETFGMLSPTTYTVTPRQRADKAQTLVPTLLPRRLRRVPTMPPRPRSMSSTLSV